MSFHGKHNGVPCSTFNCALPIDDIPAHELGPVSTGDVAEDVRRWAAERGEERGRAYVVKQLRKDRQRDELTETRLYGKAFGLPWRNRNDSD